MIPVMIFLHFFSLKSKKRKALKFANFEAIARIRGIDLYSKNLLILILSCIIVFSLIMSLSGLVLHVKISSSSFAFVIAIDSSRSMEADDIAPSRFEAAKNLAIQFVKSTKAGTKMGVISFAGVSRIEQELTEDRSLVISAIEDMQLREIGGTDLPEVIVISTKMLKNETTKAILLFSDGQLNIGDLDDAIEGAKENKIVINTIGVGTKEGGATTYGISKLDEDSLKAAAYNTEGKFFMLESSTDIEKYFEEITGLTVKDVSISLAKYLLILSVILFLIDYILINTRYRTLP
jgi:Ca-activated chloride channel family protein